MLSCNMAVELSSLVQPYRVSLGQAAEILRKAHGFKTVRALSEQTGFPTGSAYRVEGGKETARSLTLATLHAYAEAVGITMGEWFSMADDIHARTRD